MHEECIYPTQDTSLVETTKGEQVQNQIQEKEEVSTLKEENVPRDERNSPKQGQVSATILTPSFSVGATVHVIDTTTITNLTNYLI